MTDGVAARPPVQKRSGGLRAMTPERPGRRSCATPMPRRARATAGARHHNPQRRRDSRRSQPREHGGRRAAWRAVIAFTRKLKPRRSSPDECVPREPAVRCLTEAIARRVTSARRGPADGFVGAMQRPPVRGNRLRVWHSRSGPPWRRTPSGSSNCSGCGEILAFLRTPRRLSVAVAASDLGFRRCARMLAV